MSGTRLVTSKISLRRCILFSLCKETHVCVQPVLQAELVGTDVETFSNGFVVGKAEILT